MPLNLCISALKSLTITEKKKKKLLTEHSSGVAWEPIREAPAQTESEAVQSCSTAH